MLCSKKGSALVQIIILIVVMSILGTAFITLSTTEYLQSKSTNDSKQAYYYAVSGREAARQILDNTIEAGGSIEFSGFYVYGDLTTGLHKVTSVYVPGQNPTVDNSKILSVVSVSDNPDGQTQHVTIVSTGNEQGNKQTVKYTFDFTINVPASSGGSVSNVKSS